MIFHAKVSEGSSNASVIVDKFVIVPSETQESSQTLQGLWLGPILHYLDLFGIHPNTFTPHNVAQIINLFHAKRELGKFNK